MKFLLPPGADRLAVEFHSDDVNHVVEKLSDAETEASGCGYMLSCAIENWLDAGGCPHCLVEYMLACVQQSVEERCERMKVEALAPSKSTDSN